MNKQRSLYPLAVHLFFRKEGDVLLLRRFNTGYEDGSYSVVAGHVELGESVTAAAIREAGEEVGVLVKPEDVQLLGVMHRKSDDERIDFFMNIFHWEGVIENREPHKCDQLRWVPKGELPLNTISYIKEAINHFDEGKWFSEFGWTKKV